MSNPVHAAMFARAKAAPLEDCKQAWNWFDEGLNRDTMETLQKWAEEGASLETIWSFTYNRAKPMFDGMSESGREAFALCIEYAVRQAKERITI